MALSESNGFFFGDERHPLYMVRTLCKTTLTFSFIFKINVSKVLDIVEMLRAAKFEAANLNE